MTIDGKRILVTGGTGSLGQRVVRRLLEGSLGRPAKVTVLSRDEAKQHDMRLRFLQRPAATDDVIYQHARDLLAFRIGDVRDYDTLVEAVRNADIVIHAAALKQVPDLRVLPGGGRAHQRARRRRAGARHDGRRRARRERWSASPPTRPASRST